ncbi:GntR family transcriptional regulator [Thalassobacillus devorans]|uniref:GntR family transcriptional regulator n=1 Tax=Thalassobacillus devorans TaxID=279813 RepID=A0ABQ1NGP4_9BACI|nr:GntR family transcriptional regulator [Thalassobacillus devorans]NIK27309.1 GntR family transcriptional regulator [Thalassobacillus devorans]GGC76652.1 GntR family transcriptional regulator [Thalassobacillus devorans]
MGKDQKKLPLYIQIKNKLVSNIKEGIWKPGDTLPSESQLMEQYNVSRTTIRQAIRDLVQNGILETSRGAPTKVKEIPEDGLGNPGVIHHEIGTDMAVILLRMEKSQTHYHAKYQLSLPETADIFYMERLRMADGKPIAIQQSYLPLAIGDVIEQVADKKFDFFSTLGNHGIYHTNIKEHVSADNATQYEADILGVSAGEALITIERTTLGIDSKPIEYSTTKYTTKAFKYTIEID